MDQMSGRRIVDPLRMGKPEPSDAGHTERCRVVDYPQGSEARRS